MADPLNVSASRTAHPRPVLRRRLRFYGLCVAVLLEHGYQLYLASTMASIKLDREDWYWTGRLGPRFLAISGMPGWSL